MSQELIIEKNNNVKPLSERTEKEKLLFDSQMRVAVLGQLFLEAAETFKGLSGIEIINRSKVSQTIKYCEKGIAPIYNAYYTHGNSEVTRAVENEYENALNLLRGQGTFGNFSIASQTLLARKLEPESMDATVHRILKKHNIKFMK